MKHLITELMPYKDITTWERVFLIPWLQRRSSTMSDHLVVMYVPIQMSCHVWMVFMGRGFTSGGQDSGSVFSTFVCKYRLVDATLSPCH